MINVGRKDHPIYVPPELCVIRPGQPYDAELLSTKQKQQVLRFACQSPQQNSRSIISTARRVLGLESAKNSVMVSHSYDNIIPHLHSDLQGLVQPFHPSEAGTGIWPSLTKSMH